jgi:hypothetical protein
VRRSFYFCRHNKVIGMKYIANLFLIVLIAASCASKDDYNPDSHLTAKEKEAVLTSIIRYAAKAPDEANAETKFDAKFDGYYKDKVKIAGFTGYAIKGDNYYFMITQVAPSFVEKRHATGGRFKLNDKGEVTEYEEIFRTWKMVPDTLSRRSAVLFDKMVKGESLTAYETRNSNGVEYIEFPDEKVHYNVTERKWKVNE